MNRRFDPVGIQRSCVPFLLDRLNELAIHYRGVRKMLERKAKGKEIVMRQLSRQKSMVR